MSARELLLLSGLSYILLQYIPYVHLRYFLEGDRPNQTVQHTSIIVLQKKLSSTSTYKFINKEQYKFTVKLNGVFSSNNLYVASSLRIQFHWYLS